MDGLSRDYMWNEHLPTNPALGEDHTAMRIGSVECLWEIVSDSVRR